MRRWFVLACIALLGLSACEQTPAPVQTPPPSVNTPAVDSTPLPTVLPPTPTVKPVAQVLRQHITAEPDLIDPQRAETAEEIDVVMKVFGNLLAFDALGALTP